MVSHLAVSLPSFKLKELPAQILLLPQAQKNDLFIYGYCMLNFKNPNHNSLLCNCKYCPLFEGKKTPECSNFADFKHYKLTGKHRF